MLEMNKPLDSMLLCDLALHMLAACHVKLKPESSAEDFYQKIVRLVKNDDNPSIVNPVEIVMQFLSDDLRAKGVDWVAKFPAGPMLISVAYCVRAKASFEKRLTELAWSNTAQAMFWCSVANSFKRIDEIILVVEADAHAKGQAQAVSKIGKSGAVARSENMEPLREFVRNFARQSDMNWSSRNHAATAITRELGKFCEERCARTGVKVVCPTLRTVDKWLKEMPDAVSLFTAR